MEHDDWRIGRMHMCGSAAIFMQSWRSRCWGSYSHGRVAPPKIKCPVHCGYGGIHHERVACFSASARGKCSAEGASCAVRCRRCEAEGWVVGWLRDKEHVFLLNRAVAHDHRVFRHATYKTQSTTLEASPKQSKHAVCTHTTARQSDEAAPEGQVIEVWRTSSVLAKP
jgi:hypothetical protein